MDLISKTIDIKPSEYRNLVKLIYDTSGINLGDNKQELVKTRLGKRLRAIGLSSYKDYYNFVQEPSNKEERMMMINSISTNFTSFLREKQHFDFLTKIALPDIMKRNQAHGQLKLRAWCAAASTGEEPYTIALILSEFFGQKTVWDIKLLATDISTKVLALAYKGEYTLDKVKPLGPVLLDRYFLKSTSKEGNLFKVKDELKQLITFRQLNLMNPVFPFSGLFDFIMCRNVMIYFDQPTQEAVVKKLLKYLSPGGYLLIGHSENISPLFRTQVDVLAPATYRKKKW